MSMLKINFYTTGTNIVFSASFAPRLKTHSFTLTTKTCMLKTLIFVSMICSVMVSCKSTNEVEEMEPEMTLARGRTETVNTFILKTALYKDSNLFGKGGYSVDFYPDAADCKSGFAPISFFIPKLALGKIEGNGPYFYYNTPVRSGTSSFFGCEVNITKITPTFIEGTVKGGDLTVNRDEFIEGGFRATYCPK